jgi:hypothetical protein
MNNVRQRSIATAQVPNATAIKGHTYGWVPTMVTRPSPRGSTSRKRGEAGVSKHPGRRRRTRSSFGTTAGRPVGQLRILRPECGLRTGRNRSHPGFRKPPRSAGRSPDVPAIRTSASSRYVIMHSTALLFRTAGLGQNPAVHTPIGSDAALEARRRPNRSAVIVKHAAQCLV